MNIIKGVMEVLRREPVVVEDTMKVENPRMEMIYFHDGAVKDFLDFEKEMMETLFEAEPQLDYSRQRLSECIEYMNYCKQNYPRYLKACIIQSADYSFEDYVNETAYRMVNFFVYASSPAFCVKTIDMDPDGVVTGLSQFYSAICESRLSPADNACNDYLTRMVTGIIYWIAVKNYPAKPMRSILKIVGESLFDEDYTRYLIEACLISLKDKEVVTFH